MKNNYVAFVVLSFLVLFGWHRLTVKNRPAAPSRPSAPGSLPSIVTDVGAAALPPSSPVAADAPVEVSRGRHQITFNARGAGVTQWRISDGAQANLILPAPRGEEPLSAFPSLAFTGGPTPEGAAFKARRSDGLHVTQSYRLDPEGFLHSITLSLENGGKAPVDASFALGWGPGIESGDGAPAGRTAEQRALALEDKRLWELKPGTVSGPYKWFGVDARYFLAAFLSDGAAPLTVRVDKTDKLYTARRVERVTLAPGERKEFTQPIYLGPKGYDELASLNLGLERAVNFGFFASLGRLIHRALIWLKDAVGNFGWAIILLTCCVQVLLSPLTVTSFKHSQKMKALQPQMKRLQEMHKGDPQRLNREMFALYQRHGLRFMGLEGCLPVFIQMPVFFALYATLSKTYELRGAPWIGWVADLSVKDPFYVLPVLMGGAMFFQQKLTMTSTDPTQKQLMYIMPVMFTFIFLKMPSGLVIYWLTQNLLTLGLQLVLLKRSQAHEGVVR